MPFCIASGTLTAVRRLRPRSCRAVDYRAPVLPTSRVARRGAVLTFAASFSIQTTAIGITAPPVTEMLPEPLGPLHSTTPSTPPLSRNYQAASRLTGSHLIHLPATSFLVAVIWRNSSTQRPAQWSRFSLAGARLGIRAL